MNTATTRLNTLVKLSTGLRQCSFCPNPPKKVKSAQNAASLNASKYYKRMKANQSRFQVNDGKPVFLKGGFKDKILYQSTWFLIFLGLSMTIKLFYDLAKPHQ